MPLSLLSSPVASMVSELLPTSTIFARNTLAISMISLRRSGAAFTLNMTSSRSMAPSSVRSVILCTLISLCSCLVICSKGHVVGVDDGCDARHGGVFGRAHRQRLYVEAAPRDEAGHAREHAGLVLHQNGQDVLHGAHRAPPFPPSDSGTSVRTAPTATSMAPMTSSSARPGATMGYTFWSREMATSSR